MSRYFARSGATGEFGDIVWRKWDGRHYVVSVGDQTIGQIFAPSRPRGGWTAVSSAHPDQLIGLRKVEGFATRWAATEYLLDVGFRFGPMNPLSVEEVGDRMRVEQRIRELIEQSKKDS